MIYHATYDTYKKYKDICTKWSKLRLKMFENKYKFKNPRPLLILSFPIVLKNLYYDIINIYIYKVGCKRMTGCNGHPKRKKKKAEEEREENNGEQKVEQE